MKKINLFVLVFFLAASSVQAAQVTLAWDPNSETDLGGYKLHYGSTSSGAYATTVDVGNVTRFTVPGLERGRTYYFAATAYNLTGQESGYSNEVAYTIPAEYPLDDTFVVGAGGTINTATDIITVLVPTLPTNPMDYFWKKTGLSGISGQMINVRLTAFGPGPVSVIAKDALGHIASEYMIPVTADAQTFLLQIPIHPSENFELAIYPVHAPGNYHFSQIDVEVLDNPRPSAENFCIRELVLPSAGGLYKVRLQWTPEDAAISQMIKVYTESNQIFSGSGAINSYAIDSAAATMDYEIFKAQPYLGGLYFALYSVYDDGVSQPTIVSHLPGNIIGHGGDQSPPLNKMQAVDTVDYNWIFARRGGTVMVPEATDLPADSVQLANNYLLSTSLNYLTTHDVALVSLQRNAKAKLK